MNATPRPWKLEGWLIVRDAKLKRHAIADVMTTAALDADEKEANGALIVRAVNSHDAMREALEQAIARIEVANQEGNPIMSAWLPDAKAALALAKGEQ